MKRLSHMSGIIMLAMIIMVSGCANNQSQQPEQSQQQPNNGQPAEYQAKNTDSAQKINTNEQEAVIPFFEHDGHAYIPLGVLTRILEFQMDEDPESKRIRIGDNDVAYEIPTSSTDVVKEGETITLTNPTVTIEGVTYMPRDAVETVFGDAMSHTWTSQELRIRPTEELSLEEAGNIPDFQDDPSDPNADHMDTAYLSEAVSSGFGDLALVEVNASKLITTAKKYMGVKYDFGAAPYPKSNRFDCSTFTQYVYGKHDVKLSRLSRNQAKQGVDVSRTNLRKGDLMFFYLPGRYKSNKIVGHVGIYMGDGKMIHSSNKPKNGVQITSINKAFWKKTYLKSRRVAS